MTYKSPPFLPRGFGGQTESKLLTPSHGREYHEPLMGRADPEPEAIIR